MCLEVYDNRAKLASSPKREIIDPNLWYRPGWRCRQRHNASENRHPAGLYVHAICDADPKPATRGQTNHLHNLVQAQRDTRPRLGKRREALDEDFPSTGRYIAKVFANQNSQAHLLPTRGQIDELTCVTAMHACCRYITEWAARSPLG